MKITDTILFELLHKKNKVIKIAKVNYCTMFLTKHSKYLFNNLDLKNMTYYKITDNTKKRLKNVPVENIDGHTLINLQEKNESGFVYFDDLTHFVYLIKKNGVYIMTSNQRKCRINDDSKYKAGNIISGFLYYDFFSGERSVYINNVIDGINNKDNLILKDVSTLNKIKKIKKNNNLIEIEKQDYLEKFETTKLCLQAFMFIYFAKTINKTIISEKNDIRSVAQKLRNANVSDLNIIKIDTFYTDTINVINPFGVSGHYRNQPYGENRKQKKLIYIDSFMKTGYTRLATKLKINANT